MKKLALFFTLALFVFSCSKKEETQTTLPENQQQVTQQQNQIKTDEQVRLDESKKEELKKTDEKKKEDDKKKEDEKKKTDDKKKTDTKDENVSNTNGDPDTDSKTSEIDFAPIFAKRCAKCHGKDLKGKEDGGPDLTRSETQNKSDSKLFNIISTGVKAENEDDEDMPAFKGKLTDDEINAAIKFIKSH